MSSPQHVIDSPKQPARQSVRELPRQSYELDPEQLLTEHARTSFSLATRFLPDEQRQATTLLYAFFRTLDDSVDEISDASQKPVIRKSLDEWQAWSESPGNRPRQRELADGIDSIIDSYNVPRHVFGDFVDGLLSDLNQQEIRDQAELDRYCYRVASTVGIVMCHILGASHPAAVEAAAKLGAAMQLTNILRDIGEDLAIGRVYIPTETLNRHGLDHDDLNQLVGDPERARRSLAPMMMEEIERARGMYREALPAIWLLPRESRMSILLAARLYRQLLSNIEDNDYDSINFRASTSKWDKFREFSTCTILTRLWKYDDGREQHGI